MIECSAEEARYRCLVTNGRHRAFTDATRDKGGSESGFRPHELLEAALASCVTIWVRTYADNHHIPLSGVTTHVSVNRSTPGEVVFEYTIEPDGLLTKDQRHRLMEVAKSCPVRRTLSSRISFRDLKEAEIVT